jgi:hypothetical protein
MAEAAEFEEKTYEKYFGHELARSARDTFSPGQVAEGDLGFDEGFFVPWHIRNFWFRNLFPIRWLGLRGVFLADLEFLDDTLRHAMPGSRYNLFVQYKRPSYVKGHNAKEWGHWHRPYYRYPITDHQQLILEKLELASFGRAAVIYASPAFWTNVALFSNAKKKRVIAESNVAEVSKMVGHKCFTYADSGAFGVAHSEPEIVQSSSLGDILQRGVENERLSFRDHIRKTTKAIKTCFEDDELGLNNLETASETILYLIDGSRRRGRDGDFVGDLATIEAFCDLYGVQLFTT